MASVQGVNYYAYNFRGIAPLIVNAHACSRATTCGRILELTLDLSRKLSPKWGVGQYSVVGPFLRRYGTKSP